MELKLNIYDKKQIVKTYTAETYDLMFGTVEDLIQLIDLDNANIDDDVSLIKVASKVVMGGLDIIKPLLKDVFEGLTDDELKNVKVSEIAKALVEIIRFSIFEMGKGISSKN